MCRTNYNINQGKNKHLKYEERLMIERWYNRDRKTKKEIANLLNKSERTIRREIKRGMVILKDSEWRDLLRYSADKSHALYNYNLEAKGPDLKIGNDYKLKYHIENEIINNKKSPEAIIAEIEHNNLQFKTKLTARTIRNNIKLGNVFNITEADLIYKKRKRNKNPKKFISNKTPPEKSIEFRPIKANNRAEYGHWEGDSVIGKRKGSGPILFTLTERMTREEIIIKVKSKTKESIVKAFNKLERKYNKSFYEKFKTITFDNGSEFNDYKGIEKSCLRKGLRTTIYYAHPYCSGERGSNENGNRLIRRWIPKGTDIGPISEKVIKEIEDWINNYPRGIFGYKSSNMILLKI